jgi:hypothetical protein
MMQGRTSLVPRKILDWHSENLFVGVSVERFSPGHRGFRSPTSGDLNLPRDHSVRATLRLWIIVGADMTP